MKIIHGLRRDGQLEILGSVTFASEHNKLALEFRDGALEAFGAGGFYPFVLLGPADLRAWPTMPADLLEHRPVTQLWSRKRNGETSRRALVWQGWPLLASWRVASQGYDDPLPDVHAALVRPMVALAKLLEHERDADGFCCGFKDGPRIGVTGLPPSDADDYTDAEVVAAHASEPDAGYQPTLAERILKPPTKSAHYVDAMKIEPRPQLETYCKPCLDQGLREIQRETPSGPTCKFGHGGAPGVLPPKGCGLCPPGCGLGCDGAMHCADHCASDAEVLPAQKAAAAANVSAGVPTAKPRKAPKAPAPQLGLFGGRHTGACERDREVRTQPRKRARACTRNLRPSVRDLRQRVRRRSLPRERGRRLDHGARGHGERGRLVPARAGRMGARGRAGSLTALSAIR